VRVRFALDDLGGDGSHLEAEASGRFFSSISGPRCEALADGAGKFFPKFHRAGRRPRGAENGQLLLFEVSANQV